MHEESPSIRYYHSPRNQRRADQSVHMNYWNIDQMKRHWEDLKPIHTEYHETNISETLVMKMMR